MKYFTYFLLIIGIVSCRNNAKVEKTQIDPASYYTSDFFHEVQMQQIFADGKTFVDYVPKKSL